jgi:magnesium transporter
MNFHHMPELDKVWAYPAMIGLVTFTVGGIYLGLKRAKWF